jgi:thiol-disulfide isomerase/thioredoxin
MLLICLCAASTSAQNSAGEDASAASAKLRAMYFARDFEGGYVEGKRHAHQHPDAIGVKVWLIMNGSRNEKAEEALELAEKLITANQADGSRWFALAGALNFHNDRSKEALAASEKMLSLLPGNDDAIWLRASIIRSQGKVEDSLDFIERHLAKVKNPAELLVIRASALYSQYNSQQQNRDEAKLKASMDAFAEALKADPNNVNALYLQATYLLNQRKSAEAYALLKKALVLAPDSNSIHGEYWRAINGMTDLDGEAKQSEIEADMASLLKRRGTYLGTLLIVSNRYDAMKLAEKKKEIGDRILQLEPLSREAEWVLIGRTRQLASEIYQEKERKDPAKLAAYRRMLQEYVNRPRHFHKGLLGEVYRNLFYELREDSGVSNAELFNVAKGMIAYEKNNVHSTYPAAAIALAQRKTNFREAEAWAREGIVEARKKVESQRQFYKSDADYEKALSWMTGMMSDALGWVFFNEGRLGEAEKELLQAHKLNAEEVNNLYHLGQFYNAQKDYVKAEEYYIKGSLVATPGENKNIKELKALYEIRNGNLDGYDKYLARVGEIDTANRKVKVLADRIKDPQPMNAFKLKSLDGKLLSSIDLKGRVVIVNHWGIWCGPCVQEMPEFQKLHEKYKDDTSVVVLSINNDQNPSDVPKWMQNNKYNFNVLFDDGYLGKAGINAFPTTWFIDKDGRIVFVKVGRTQRLTEEFSWRIEALRAKAVAGGPTSQTE